MKKSDIPIQINKIHSMDCLEGLKKLPDKSIDLAFIDPPYNVGKDYGIYKDSLPEEEYLEMMENVINEFRRVTKRGFGIYTDWKQFQRYWKLIPEAEPIIIYKKSTGFIFSPLKIMQHHHIILTTAKALKPVKSLWDDIRVLGEGYLFNEKRFGHPAQTSLKATKRFIEHFSEKGDIVVDCFAGCGTTVIEAKSLGRNALGYEINQEGVRIANNMLKQSTLHGNTKLINLVKRKDSKTIIKEDIKNDGKREYVDFILTSPPYYNNLPYSEDKEQLGTIEDYNKFLDELNIIWNNCFNVLKEDGFMCVVVGDCRGSMKKRKINGHHGLIPLHCDIVSQCRKLGFYLWDIIIHPIYNMNSLHNFFYMRWLKQNNLQFINHDYILVFRKFNPQSFKYVEGKDVVSEIKRPNLGINKK